MVNGEKNREELHCLKGNGWLSNFVIDTYLNGIDNHRRELTIHHSNVALLLQGGAGNFADVTHQHPSRWNGKNLIPTIVRSSEHVGVHWVLLEVDVDSKEIKMYDSMGTKHRYQYDLLEIIKQTLMEEIY